MFILGKGDATERSAAVRKTGLRALQNQRVTEGRSGKEILEDRVVKSFDTPSPCRHGSVEGTFPAKREFSGKIKRIAQQASETFFRQEGGQLCS